MFGCADKSDGLFVRRKNLGALDNTKHIQKIRDPAIRRIVEEYVRTKGIDPDVPQKLSKVIWEPGPCMPSGVPIKKVRMIERGEGMFAKTKRRR